MSKLEELIKALCPDGVEYRTISQVCNISRGVVISKEDILNNLGEYPVYSSQTENNGELGKINTYAFDGEYLTWTTDGANAGTVFYRTGKFSVTNVCGLLKVIASDNLARYIFHVLSVEAPKYVRSGMGNPKLMSNVMGSIKIPLPPLPVQEEIVRILDKFTELTARKKQYEYYKNELFSKAENAQITTLDMIAKNCDSQRKPVTSGIREAGDIPYYGASGIVDYVKDYIFDGDYLLISEDGANLLARNTPIAFSISGKTWVNNHAHVLKFDEYATRRYVEMYLNSIDLAPYITGAAQPKLNQKNLNNIKIPLPPLPEQERIVDILDRFDTLCNDISSGLPAEIKARQQQYEYYRDKLLTFPKAELEV